MMGSLTPDARYVYESPDGGDTIYAREPGSTDRILVGYSYKKQTKDAELKQIQLWTDIRKEAATNPALQKAMDRVILIYNLSKENKNE